MSILDRGCSDCCARAVPAFKAAIAKPNAFAKPKSRGFWPMDFWAGAEIDAVQPSGASIATLHGDPIAEAHGRWPGGGAHPEVHQIGALAGHRLKRAELPAGPWLEGGRLVYHLQAGAIGEAHERGHREGGTLGRGRREEKLIAAEVAVHDEIRVPVGAAKQTIRADPFRNHRLAAAAEWHQKAATGLGAASGGDGQYCGEHDWRDQAHRNHRKRLVSS